MLFLLARIAEGRNDPELDHGLYGQSEGLVAPFMRQGFGAISVMLALARTSAQLDRLEDQARYAEEALRASRRSGYRFQIGRSLMECAQAAQEASDIDRACNLPTEAFEAFSDQRWRQLRMQCAHQFAELERLAGCPIEAARCRHEVDIAAAAREEASS